MGLIVAGPTDDATDRANMGTIRLRRDQRALMMIDGLPRTVYQDLYLGGKAFVERENVGFDLARPLLYFHRRPPAKGVGLRVADFLTGNHPEDDFTPLETIQRSHSITGKMIPFELEGETFEPERRVRHQLAIRVGKIQKDKRKPQGEKGKDNGKNKLAYTSKPKITPPPKRNNLAKGSICHHYKEGYAFESASRILNMVSTKKVKRTSYEIWHGKAPKLSYLKLFKKKIDMDGNVHTFKARMVAKSYTQTNDVDYGKTFSPVVDIRAIRILLAIVAFYDYEIWQMDVKTAFLNGHLSEEVYMVQPKGFVDTKHPNKVCELQCFIYGLKQASRSWNKRFNVEIKKIGFSHNPDEPCVYLKASGSSFAFLILYVNDILLMGNNITMLQEVKSWLYKCFSMKDLGEATYILGIKIIHDKSKRLIILSQSAYLEKTLKKFRMENSKKGNTKDMVLVYGAKPEAKLKVSCYADASFKTYKDDTKSQAGYVFVHNGGVVGWKSAKQSTTATSSTEFDYITGVEASMEAFWMRNLLMDLAMLCHQIKDLWRCYVTMNPQ
uniref:Retrotransposon protein, putative, Ty1-copia subclass n=1 Tax=Tanacetum cinerariifolium TaxID=118510 RepID=A0A6L2NA06_TANCI|nr:retrotransposon protein, putative, Ty1-copia subclass [Tanacetum cinerariifolium]